MPERIRLEPGRGKKRKKLEIRENKGKRVIWRSREENLRFSTYSNCNASIGIRPRTKSNRLSIGREKCRNCQGGGKTWKKARSKPELWDEEDEEETEMEQRENNHTLEGTNSPLVLWQTFLKVGEGNPTFLATSQLLSRRLRTQLCKLSLKMCSVDDSF